MSFGPFEEPDDEWRNVSLVIPKYNARIMVVSADQSIRGIRHNEHRPDLIIGDDVEDVASAKTYEQREKLERWFASEIVPVGDFGTKIVFVGNVVNEDGLMFRLRDRIQSGEIHGSYHAFPIIENGRPTWAGKFPSIRHVQDLKKKSDTLSRNVVEEVRTVFEEKNDTTIYIPKFYPTPEYTRPQ